VYVDSNAVIYAVERIEPYRTLLEPLWQAAYDGKIAIMTSELTWLETLTKPIRDQNPQLEALFHASIATGDDVSHSTALQ